jgi:hypothetical protein
VLFLLLPWLWLGLLPGLLSMLFLLLPWLWLRLLPGLLGTLLLLLLPLLWLCLLLFGLGLLFVPLFLLSVNLDNNSGKRHQGDQAHNSKEFHIGPPFLGPLS